MNTIKPHYCNNEEMKFHVDFLNLLRKYGVDITDETKGGDFWFHNKDKKNPILMSMTELSSKIGE